MQVVGVYLFFEKEINPDMGAARAQIVYSHPAKYNEKKYTLLIMKKNRCGYLIWDRKRYSREPKRKDKTNATREKRGGGGGGGGGNENSAIG